MKLDELSQLFKCLSDPVRLRVLNLLFHQDDLCVCDIVSTLDLPQSVVSRHLAYLRRHQLVVSERRGNWQYYSHTLFRNQSEQAQQPLRDQLASLLQSEPLCQQDVVGLETEKGCC